jgi:hypothetical protein
LTILENKYLTLVGMAEVASPVLSDRGAPEHARQDKKLF